MLCGPSCCCPCGWCDLRCIGSIVAHVVVPELIRRRSRGQGGPRRPFGKVLFHDEEEGAAACEARRILYGCTSSDDTLSAEWALDSGCEAALAAAQAESPSAATAIPPKRSEADPPKSKNKDTPADFEVFEVSVTLTGGSCDIDLALLDGMVTFLKEYCPAGMFALERGETVSHLHLQCGCRSGPVLEYHTVWC